jgi:hypothetical protein
MKKLFYLLPVLFFILSCEKEEPEAEKETTIEFSHDFEETSRDYLKVDVYLYGYNANDEKIFEHPLRGSWDNYVYSIPAPTDVKKVKVYCVILHYGESIWDDEDEWTEKFWVDYITYLIPNKANTISIDENILKSESEPE